MPIISHIDRSRDLTVFTVKGLLTFDEVTSTIEAFYAGEPTKHVLWDLLKVTKNLIPLEQAETIVTSQPRLAGKRESGKTAIVVQDHLLSGLSNVLGTQNNLLEALNPVMVFSTRKTAYKWFDEP